MSIEIEHKEMVLVLRKPGDQIISEMTGPQADLLHMAIGVSGEGGELLDAVKRFAIYQKPLDRDNVEEELGDLEFYMEGVRQLTGITREQSLKRNMEKLAVRYQQRKYSNQEAQDRKDKK